MGGKRKKEIRLGGGGRRGRRMRDTKVEKEIRDAEPFLNTLQLMFRFKELNLKYFRRHLSAQFNVFKDTHLLPVTLIASQTKNCSVKISVSLTVVSIMVAADFLVNLSVTHYLPMESIVAADLLVGYWKNSHWNCSELRQLLLAVKIKRMKESHK